MPAGTHAPVWKIYLSAKSRVIMLKQVDISTPFDLVANRIRAMPSCAGKRQCPVSVLSSRICPARIIDQLFFGALCWDVIIAVFFSHLFFSPKIKTVYNYGPGNHRKFEAQLLLAGAEISSVRRGLSYTEITLMMLFGVIVVLPPFFCPAAKYPTPTPISHPYLRRAVPIFNDACAEGRVSLAHESDSGSSSGTSSKWQQQLQQE